MADLPAASTWPTLLGPRALVQWIGPWWLPGARGPLEAVVSEPSADPDQGPFTVRHWWCAQNRPDQPWMRGAVVSERALAAATLGVRGRWGRQVLLAWVPEPDGLIEYLRTPADGRRGAWRPFSARSERWRRVGPVAAPDEAAASPVWDGPDDAAEWGSGRVIATATVASSLRGWTQALVQVDGSVYHLHRQQRPDGPRWFRHACLRLADDEPFAVATTASNKVTQISGELDSQPVLAGLPRPTLSTSVSRSGVRGTDLGVRIDHDGRTFLLFGDTHWTRPWLATRDAIAEVFDPAAELPKVGFHGSPLSIRGGATTLREYDVPLDAFSLDGELFAFFTSDHFRDAQVMGRSVLTAAPPLDLDPAARRDPLRFAFRGTVSDHRFVNVSVQRVGDHLYLWGTGAYRADDVRLARLDLAAAGVRTALRSGNAPSWQSRLEFWAGPDGTAGQQWSNDERAAVPLFTPGAHGELSVRWSSHLGRFLMLTMSGPGDPIGPAVVLRTALHPWGPWSRRLRLFDWVAGGMSPTDPRRRFIRSRDDDPVGDAVFAKQARATGAAYAPYLFDVTAVGQDVRLRYTLSTWNPYQTVLMESRLTPTDLDPR